MNDLHQLLKYVFLMLKVALIEIVLKEIRNSSCLTLHSTETKPVLALSGIDLIFFIVAGVGLCFAFMLETGLIIEGCFSYC